MPKFKKGVRSRSKTPARNRQGSRGGLGVSLRDQNKITRVTGRLVTGANMSATAMTTTITEINLTVANLGDRVVNIADTFLYWRLVKFNYYQDVQAGQYAVTTKTLAESYLHAACFMPMSNANYAAPTTINQSVDFPEFKQANGLRQVRLSVGRSGTIGSMMTKWLTVNTTSDSDAQSAGTLTLISVPAVADPDTVAAVRGIFSFEIEFKEPIDTALVPSRSRTKLVATSLVPNRQTEVAGNKVTTLVDNVKSRDELKVPTDEKKEGWTVAPFAFFR